MSSVHIQMEPANNVKIYASQTKKILKNGTIKYYPTQKRYTLVRGSHNDLTQEAVEDIKIQINNGCILGE